MQQPPLAGALPVTIAGLMFFYASRVPCFFGSVTLWVFARSDARGECFRGCPPACGLLLYAAAASAPGVRAGPLGSFGVAKIACRGGVALCCG